MAMARGRRGHGRGPWAVAAAWAGAEALALGHGRALRSRAFTVPALANQLTGNPHFGPKNWKPKTRLSDSDIWKW
jgi:hypothetical protein